jgi:fumarate hydratase subunit beta
VSITTHRLQLPLTDENVQKIRAGDLVYLDGVITISAGLPTFDRIFNYVKEGKDLPVDLTGAALFHLGSYSREVDGKFEVSYMNPTTSTRFNAYMPTLIRGLKLKAVGGKGGLDHESAKALQEVGCIYLSFLGGGATLHSQAIKEVVSVDWPDFIAHYRLTRLRVENLGPLTVGIDAHGGSLYDSLAANAQAKLPEILKQMKESRVAQSH